MRRLLAVTVFFLLFVSDVCPLTGSGGDIFSWSETNDMGKPYTTFLNQNNVVNSAPASGTMKTISEQGRYYFSGNMHISPANTDVTCLKITSSNVILDLRGYTIMGNTTTGAGMIGIEVDSNLSNIQILNGTISSMNGTAIKINGGCSDIKIRNISVNQCTLAGITIDSSDDIHLNGVGISGCDGSHANAATVGAVGLRLRWCNRVRVMDSHFDGNQVGAIDRDVAGVYVRESQHCEFVHCSATQNRAGSTAGNAGHGFKIFMGSDNAMLKDCMAACTHSQDGPSYGFYINESNGLIMEHCVSHGNRAMGTDTIDSAYGFCLSGTAGGAANLVKCKANQMNGSSNVYGFYMDQSNYNYLMDCEARNQTTSSVITTTVAGFYSNLGQGNTFKNCNSFGNVGAADASAICCGFYLTGGEKYSNILYSEAKSNDGSTGLGHGIFLDSARSCTIRGNELFVNVGVANGYGILDNETSSVSCYFENFAYGNGSTSGLVVNNFDVKLSPTDSVNVFPIQTAFLEDFRPLKDQSPYDNIELIERAVTDNL